MENKVQGMMGTTLEKLRSMVDANTVIGDPLQLDGGITLIPVSRISYGFAAGGSDLPSKTQRDLFGGGSGAGVNVTPIAFLVVSGGKVDMLQLVAKPDTSDRLVNMIPDVVDKLTELISGKKKTELEDAGL